MTYDLVLDGVYNPTLANWLKIERLKSENQNFSIIENRYWKEMEFEA